MSNIYVVEVLMGNDVGRLGDAHLISYNAPKLVLRASAKNPDIVSLMRKHVTEHTILTFRLASEGSELWVSPPFRAQVTSAGEQELQFELTLLDDVDLSRLRAA